MAYVDGVRGPGATSIGRAEILARLVSLTRRTSWGITEKAEYVLKKPTVIQRLNIRYCGGRA